MSISVYMSYMKYYMSIVHACTKSKNINYGHGIMIGKASLNKMHLKKLKQEKENKGTENTEEDRKGRK